MKAVSRLVTALAVLAVLVIAAALVWTRLHHTDAPSSDPTRWREPGAAAVVAALPAQATFGTGWTRQPAGTDDFFATVTGLMTCGVDTSGAVLPLAQSGSSYFDGTTLATSTHHVQLAIIAAANATDSQRLLAIGRSAVECAQRAGRDPLGPSYHLDATPKVTGADGPTLAMTITTPAATPGATPTVSYAVAATAGPFGVAAIGDTRAGATRAVNAAIALLRR